MLLTMLLCSSKQPSKQQFLMVRVWCWAATGSTPGKHLIVNTKKRYKRVNKMTDSPRWKVLMLVRHSMKMKTYLPYPEHFSCQHKVIGSPCTCLLSLSLQALNHLQKTQYSMLYEACSPINNIGLGSDANEWAAGTWWVIYFVSAERQRQGEGQYKSTCEIARYSFMNTIGNKCVYVAVLLIACGHLLMSKRWCHRPVRINSLLHLESGVNEKKQ